MVSKKFSLGVFFIGITVAAVVIALFGYFSRSQIGAQSLKEQFVIQKDGGITYTVLGGLEDKQNIFKMVDKAELARQFGCKVFDCPTMPTRIDINYRLGVVHSGLTETTFGEPLRFTVSVNAKDWDDALNIVSHEMGHVVFRTTRGAFISGLEEPAANLLKGPNEFVKLALYLNPSEKCYLPRQILTSGIIAHNFLNPPSSLKIKHIQQFYADASAMMLYLLLEEGGLDKWNKYFHNGSKLGYSESLFQEVYGFGFSELKQKWYKWISDNFPKSELPSAYHFLEEKFGKDRLGDFLRYPAFVNGSYDQTINKFFGINYNEWVSQYQQWMSEKFSQELEEKNRVQNILEERLKKLINQKLN